MRGKHLLALTILLLVGCGAMAAEPLASLHRNGVTVSIDLEPGAAGQATLVGRFVPDERNSPLHLYGLDLIGDIGRPTRLALKPGGPVVAAGPLTADREARLQDGLSIYPAGPVTLRLPITLPASADGQPVAATVLVTYMACTASTCLPPVEDVPLLPRLPSVKREGGAPPATDMLDQVKLRAAVDAALAVERPALARAVREQVAAELRREREDERGGIRWRRPTTVAEAESLIREAHAAGQRALLDFTGPSCVNCQAMAKQVFPLGVVRQAWNRGLPIELDTDRHAELAQWQQSRFQTQARPLYVRLDPGGDEARWSEAISPKNGEDVARLAVFLVGGAGSDAGSGAGLVQFLLLAVAGGLVTLLMPCTYPMIPFTLNFFARQVASGRRLVPLAMFYGLGIVGCFVGVGVFITGVLRLPLAQVAGHPLTNLAIAALFVVFGLSLLGVVVLRLPAVLEGRLGGSRAGYFGALLMGLTFAVSAFTCAAPFAGTILAQAVADGTWRYAAWGMAVYSAVIALPFVLLALAPGVLTRLPKAGAWMNEVKIAGGFIELAAALKFLVICDAQWRWGVFGRTTVLAAWAAAALVIGLYVFGRLRLPGDVRLTEIGVGRLLTGLAFIALGLWFVAGLTGANLGVIEAFFPADAAPL